MATQTIESKVSERVPLTPEEEKVLKEGSLTDYEIQAHPREYFRAMRHGDPIHYDEKLGSWLVTRHEDIWAVQSDPVTFSVHHGYHDFQARGLQDEFRAYLEDLKDKQVDWVRKKESEEVAAAVEASLQQFIKKVTGRSMAQLKQADTREERLRCMDTLKRLFGDENRRSA